MLEANSAADCIGVITWMHTFSPAKMWIAGPRRAAQAAAAPAHPGRIELPWSTIDMDFMNLNQAAHGDREFGYIQTRLGVARKTVAGHVSDPIVVGRVVGLGPGSARSRMSCARSGSRASATTCATSP